MVEWVVLIVSNALAFIGGLAIQEWRMHRERSLSQQDDIDEWYKDVATYAGELQRIWKSKVEERDAPNYSELQRTLKIRANAISRHSSEGENLNVDQEIIKQLETTAKKCRGISTQHLGIGAGSRLDGEGEELVEEAEKLQRMAQERL